MTYGLPEWGERSPTPVPALRLVPEPAAPLGHGLLPEPEGFVQIPRDVSGYRVGEHLDQDLALAGAAVDRASEFAVDQRTRGSVKPASLSNPIQVSGGWCFSHLPSVR